MLCEKGLRNKQPLYVLVLDLVLIRVIFCFSNWFDHLTHKNSFVLLNKVVTPLKLITVICVCVYFATCPRIYWLIVLSRKDTNICGSFFGLSNLISIRFGILYLLLGYYILLFYVIGINNTSYFICHSINIYLWVFGYLSGEWVLDEKKTSVYVIIKTAG